MSSSSLMGIDVQHSLVTKAIFQRKKKKELNFSGIGRGIEYELHVVMTHIPFGDSVNGVEINPGSLGRIKNNTFKLFHSENADGNVVYTFVIKLKGKEEFVGTEPQVLHPEDKPIISADG